MHYFLFYLIVLIMDNKEIKERINDINIENIIWGIYIFIIILSFYSNILEKDYFINNNIESKDKYRLLNIVIFSILLVVYIYFFNDSCSNLKNINEYDDNKKEKIILAFLASLFVLISGIIFLYLAYEDKNLDVELAFN